MLCNCCSSYYCSQVRQAVSSCWPLQVPRRDTMKEDYYILVAAGRTHRRGRPRQSLGLGVAEGVD